MFLINTTQSMHFRVTFISLSHAYPWMVGNIKFILKFTLNLTQFNLVGNITTGV